MQALANPTLETTSTGTNRWLVALLPSFTDLAFVLPALWLFGRLSGSATLLSDGDTGWHIRAGQWIWNHHAVPTTDLFSFTMPHGNWYAWEWLWDILFAGIHHFGGLGAVAFVSVCLLGVISVLLFRLIQRTTGNDVLSLGFTVLAMGSSTIHWLARPHLFSFLFVLVFAHLLLSARRNSAVLLALPFLTVLWTNLHGAFFLGILMLLLTVAGEVLDCFFHALHFWDAVYHRTRAYLACAAVCLLCSLLNPYGWHLHQHIVSYVSDVKLLAMNGEFQPLSFLNPAAFLFEYMLLLALPAMLLCFSRRQYAAALGIGFWAHLALHAGRNVPFFVLLSAPAAASLVQEIWVRSARTRRLQTLAVRMNSLGARIGSVERLPRLYAPSAIAVLLLAVAFASKAPQFEGEFNPKFFPASALSFVKHARLNRLFTTDTWASYFVYNLYPSQPSFMDGRSDYFGADMGEQYRYIINARWDWERVLDRYAVDSVALGPEAPVVSLLKTSKNWKLLFDDGSVLIFGRQPAGANAASVHNQFPLAETGAGKTLGSSRPSLTLCSNTQSQERRS